MRKLAAVVIVSFAICVLCTTAQAKTMQVTGYVFLGVIQVNEDWKPRAEGYRGPYWRVEKNLQAAYIEKPVHTFGAMAYAMPRYQITGDKLPEIIKLFKDAPSLPRAPDWGGRLDSPASFQRGGKLVVRVVGDVKLQRQGKVLRPGESRDPDYRNKYGDLYTIRVDRIIKSEPGIEWMKRKGLETIRRMESELAAGRKGTLTSWWWIGCIYEMIGDIERALETWKKAQRLEPEHRKWIAGKLEKYEATEAKR